MEPLNIIQKYYDSKSDLYSLLVKHSEQVKEKALNIAEKVKYLKPDTKFIKEASILHDIGIFLTYNPKIGCFGDKEYICHGYLGREILEKEGYPKHALLCERHLGVGITKKDIIRNNLPLPERDMIPISIEEQIVCFADKFFSKEGRTSVVENSIEEIKKNLAKFGNNKIEKFEEWQKLFFKKKK